MSLHTKQYIDQRARLHVCVYYIPTYTVVSTHMFIITLLQPAAQYSYFSTLQIENWFLMIFLRTEIKLNNKINKKGIIEQFYWFIIYK